MSTAALDLKALASSGIYSFDSFAPLLTQRVEYLVDGLLPSPSISVLVGDSGLGKTPLGVQLGLCVASGLPFLGRATRQGIVLFCDAESPTTDFNETIKAVGAFLGLDPFPGSSCSGRRTGTLADLLLVIGYRALESKIG